MENGHESTQGQRLKGRTSLPWHRKLLFSTICVLTTIAALELGSYGALLVYYSTTGKDLSVINSQLFLGSPFFDDPVTTNTDAQYVGHSQNAAAARRWRIADSLLGWRLGSSVGVTRVLDEGRSIQWHVSNNQGFAAAGALDFHVERPKPPALFRVVILGGSAVEGYGARTPLGNLPSFVARLAETTMQPPRGLTRFEFVNAGVGGYTSTHEFLYFATEIIDLQPNLVIFYDGWNDHVAARNILDSSSRAPQGKRAEIHDELSDRLNRSYSLRGALGLVAENLYGALQNVGSASATRFLARSVGKRLFQRSPSRSLPAAADKMRRRAALYANNVRDSIALARANNIQLAHFLQPIIGVDGKTYVDSEERWFDSNSGEIRMRRAFYQDARQQLSALDSEFGDDPGVCIADLSGALAKSTVRLYEDSGHLTEKGNQLMADVMLRKLVECEMMTPRLAKAPNLSRLYDP